MSDSQNFAQYVDRKSAAHSYRPKSGLMSPGLKRAREPYRFRNALTGLALGAFAVGVWAYSISAVKQDVFDDVDEEVEAMRRSGLAAEQAAGTAGTPPTTTTSTTVENPALATTTTTISAPGTTTSAPSLETKLVAPRRGILQYLDHRLPWLLHPQQKTIVWNAPPVDNVGKIGRR